MACENFEYVVISYSNDPNNPITINGVIKWLRRYKQQVKYTVKQKVRQGPSTKKVDEYTILACNEEIEQQYYVHVF